jgi:hypothetical protein
VSVFLATYFETNGHFDSNVILFPVQTSSLTAKSIPGLRPISSRTVRNRLREHNIRPRRPQSVQLCCLDTVQLGWRGVAGFPFGDHVYDAYVACVSLFGHLFWNKQSFWQHCQIISCHICKLSANDRCQTETLLHHVSLAARCLGSIIGRIADVLAWCYVRRFRQSGNTRDHRRSGCPCVTSRRLDNHIRLVHLRNRFQTSSLTAKSIPGLRLISVKLFPVIYANYWQMTDVKRKPCYTTSA